MNNGYIKLWRCIKDNPIWFEEPFTRGQAWIDLLMVANHKIGTIRRRGIRVTVNRGEVGMSLRELAERWRWSLGKVQRFFDDLKIDTQIHYRMDTENLNVTNLICITNYEKYQSTDTETDTKTDTETIRKQVQNKNEKNKKKKEEEKKEYAEKVFMTDDQYIRLVEKYGATKTTQAIEKLSLSKCANSKMKYDSDYHAILKWVIAAVERDGLFNKTPPVETETAEDRYRKMGLL